MNKLIEEIMKEANNERCRRAYDGEEVCVDFMQEILQKHLSDKIILEMKDLESIISSVKWIQLGTFNETRKKESEAYLKILEPLLQSNNSENGVS